MAINLFKASLGAALTAGIATAVLTPILLPVLVRSARPLARQAVKTGLIICEKGRETLAEAEEALDDLVAEARVELEREGLFQPAVKDRDWPAQETVQESPNPPGDEHPNPGTQTKT